MPYLPYFGVLSQSTAPAYVWSLFAQETASLGIEDFSENCGSCYGSSDCEDFLDAEYPATDFPGFIAVVIDGFGYWNYFESVVVA